MKASDATGDRAMGEQQTQHREGCGSENADGHEFGGWQKTERLREADQQITHSLCLVEHETLVDVTEFGILE